MSISGIDSPSSYAMRPPTAGTGPGQEVRDAMKALQSALDSGDQDTAQSAYDSLISALETKVSSTDGGDTRAQALIDQLSGVGEALEAGDLEAAQTAFASGVPQGPPPPGPPPGEAASEEMTDAIGTLSEALQSGDLDSAQSAYSDLISLLESESADDEDDSTTGSLSASDRFLAMLQDVGSALGSGNVDTAQQIFSLMTPRGSQGVNVIA